MRILAQKTYWKKGISVLTTINLVVLIFSNALPLRAEETTGSSANSVASAQSSDIASSTTEVAASDTTTTQSTEANLTSENSNTGANSTNNTTTENSNQADVTNQNTAVTYNDSYLKAETGKNIANYNTGSGIVTTQKAKGQGEIVNVINKNTIIPPDGVAGQASAGNENTGANSNNTATTNLNNQLIVKNINDSNTINRMEAKVNSGGNEARYNTGHGIILSGEASLGLNFVSLANTNLVGQQKFYANWQNVYESWSGDIDLAQETAADLSPLSDLLIDASNKSTGAGSSNQAIVNVNDQVSVTNQNTGKLNNEIKADVVSGRNLANQNTGTGSVTSGNVNSSVNVLNFLNSNISSSNWWLKNLNVFGNWNGDILMPQMPKPKLSLQIPGSLESGNSQTGYNSTNDATASVNNSLDISNTNQAIITNDVTLRAISGENKTSYNGGSGIVKYGNAEAETNELNVANLNVTGDSWWLVVVNTFGNWVGTTVGSPSDMMVDASGVSTILTPQNSGIKVTNNSTGPNSNNTAGANISHSTDITNSNQADILNKIDVSAVTGENEAQYNTGHGYVDTGDIRATNNLINFANANIAVGNWSVVVVNVFGNWTGNLVFNTPDNDVSAQGSLGGSIGGDGNSASNSSTGAGSTNNSSSGSTNNTSVINTNTSNTTNTASGSSTTGDNSASYNTGSGIVTTGGADTNISINNQTNNNTTNLNSSGSASGSGSSSNQNTGAGSTNDSSSTNSNNTSVNNNNTATTNNNVTANNNTGSNSSNYNTGNGVVDSGWANTYLGLYNDTNENDLTMSQLEQDFNGSSSSQGSGSDTGTGTSGATGSSGSGSGSGSGTSGSGSGSGTGASGTGTSGAGSGTSTGSGSGSDTSSQGSNNSESSGSNNNSGSNNSSGTSNQSSNNSSNSSNNSNNNSNTSAQNNNANSAADNNNSAANNSSANSGRGGGGGLGLANQSTGKKSLFKGDLNGDGKVNDFDFSILMANWGKNFKDARADANSDGKIDDFDFSIVMSSWNKVLAVLN